MALRRILLIDGNNLAHRNHYAQNLSTSSGQSTGMIYGTINSIISTQREIKADLVVVVWDPPGGSQYRKELYKLYKANRDAKEQSFYDEMTLLKQVLTSLGIAQVTKDGVECDDVIGYISKCLYPEAQVFILSNDKDFLQLCDQRIVVLHPDKGPYTLSAGKVTFKDGTKYVSIRPDQVPSYKALVGDTSDNYPGMPQFGVGAAITFFESNDHCMSIVEGTADLRRLRSQALSGIMMGRSMIKTFLDLATINVEQGAIPEPVKPAPNKNVAIALFEQLEFKQFLTLGDSLFHIGGSNV